MNEFFMMKKFMSQKEVDEFNDRMEEQDHVCVSYDARIVPLHGRRSLFSVKAIYHFVITGDSEKMVHGITDRMGQDSKDWLSRNSGYSDIGTDSCLPHDLTILGFCIS